MLSIPLPFIASLLLLLTAIVVRTKLPQSGQKAVWFILLCAVATAIVGLRWSFDVPLFRFIQPITGALIPIAAWLCFANARGNHRQRWLHIIGPLAVTVCAFNYGTWLNAVDILLIALYVGYGIALFATSFSVPARVRITNIHTVNSAERAAGGLLLFSAFIDGVLSYDFMANNADHAKLILSISYLILIPAIVYAVVIVSASVPPKANNQEDLTASLNPPTPATSTLSQIDAKNIVDKLDVLMKEKQVFLDPDLTLNRLARKLGIPARLISQAVNHVCGENISKVMNGYRIEYAKQLLTNTNESISDIYLQSGFHTKSNFNREFSRITGQTPSAYRQTGE
ncbi:AraC family transcriptional regulator [Enterovibrio sp. ZSDZ35]|uniref:AraC family transcriptional regulator n=1 Tax=Enterovibrio qingdaonensis TaxID=2899818 RepID=A0ABT5QI29_9GAMM|nr:AraC family transcriptional regulator [Enterovibrio sp. ZSDZ35]MDD1779986.1 AraC family transcriptional regulator [Enterovibrio sp. ZSDZ35]